MRVLRLKQSYFGVSIHGVGERKLEKSPWLKNGLRNKNQLIEQIQEVLNSAKPHPIDLTKAIASIPEASVFSKVLTMPRLSAKELAQAIPFEAAEFLPLPLEEMYLDWHIGPRQAKKGEDEMHVFLVAAPKQLVDELTEMLGKANIELLKLESEPFAIARALNQRLKRDEVKIVLNIGHHNTACILLNQSTIKLSSTLTVGANALRAEPQKATGALNAELADALAYYHNRLGEVDEVNKIILSGSGALIKELPALLKKAGGFDCEIGYPSVMLPGHQPVHPRFNGVIGLALGQV